MANLLAQLGQRNLNNVENIFFINGYMKESRNGTDDFEDLLIPSRYSFHNHENIKSPSDHSIYLLSKACNFDIFKYIPQQFTITTINSSGKFNKDMLMNTSSVISDFLKENPNQFQYHVDIKDDDNTISKFEQLYQGQKVTFDEYELIFTRKFTEKLNLINFPNFIKPKNMKSNFDQTLYSNRYRNQSVDYSDLSVKIGLISFKYYLQNNISTHTFKISTKKAEYECSIFGIISSTLIRELISKDPMIDHYFYDYEDEEGEFQCICDLFNFKRIKLTRDNAEIIKEIGEDLKIDFILSSTEKFIVDSEKVLKAIDDQQSIIDTIDELFELLYNIKDKSVNMVASIIMDSKWSSSEEKIIELAAFILQVISNSIQLHPYLVDLLLKLDENSGEKVDLKKLIPFIINQLFLYMTDSCISIERRTKNSFYPFIYQLYKRNIIKKEQLLEKLKITGFGNSYLISWFLPEIIEAKPDYSNYVYNEKENYVIFKEGHPRHRLVFPCNLNKLDEFKKMRDKGEYDNEIANALRIDDVDTFQSIVSKKGENFLNETIKINIFEPFLNENTRFLNYAAAYGSIKCFKYLLLNDEKIDQSTFDMAVLGGNNELIRIVDNEKKNTNVNTSTNNKKGTFKFSFHKTLNRSIYNSNISPLTLAIKNHRNDLFDWLLEQNIEKINNVNSDKLINLILCSIENGNAHSIVQLVDNGFKFQSHTKNYSKFLSLACENGFSILANLLIKIISKDINQEISISPRSAVIFGSLSIFQLFEKTMNQTKLNKAIIEAIKLNSTNIINYFFESFIDNPYVLNEVNSIQILQNSIANNSNEVLNYVFDKVNSLCPLKLFNVSSLYDLLKTTIINNKVVISKKIIDLIYDSNSNNNFTNVFYQAVLENMKEIIEYLIDKKCIIFYENIVDQITDFGTIDVDIFSLIMNNVNSQMKQIMSNSIDDAIKNKNKPLIEHLLKLDALLPSSLIEAVHTNDLEIVEMILKKDSSPSFINKNLQNGNALLISVQNNNLPIFKRLISIPGINPSIYYKKMKTPLVLSALNSNEKMFDLLVEFYGEKNIKSQKWQLEKAIEIIEDQDKPAPSKSAFSKYKAEVEKNVDPMKHEMKIKFLSKIARLKCVDPNYFFNDNNFLNYACKINAIEVVESLLQCENIDVNIFTPEKGDTPLITAVQNNNEIIAKLLIEYPQTNINQNNYDEKSAFYFAVVNKQETIVDLLLKSDKFDPKESNINYAFLFSNVEISKLILSYKTFDINYVPLINQEIDDIDVRFKYISSKRKQTKQKSIFESRLTKSVKQNEKEIVELIINHPSFDKTKSQYFDAIETAIFENRIELLNQSFKMNVNFHPIIDNSNLKIDVFNIDTNENVISYCITLQSLNLIEIESIQNGKKYLKTISKSNLLFLNCFNFLLENGMDPNEPLANGKYILEEAIQDNLIDVISSIPFTAIDFNKQISNRNGLSKFTTYLHIAARCGNISFVQEIIDQNNIDINIVNDLGETPLMEAIRFGQLEFVQFLCEIPQLDFRHKNNNGEDALQIMKSLNNKNDDLPEYDINTIDRDEYFSIMFSSFENAFNDNY